MIKLELNGKTIQSRIYIGGGILKQAAEFCLHRQKKNGVQVSGNLPSRICVITDTNVAPIYLDTLKEALKQSDIPVFVHIIQAGEEFKTLETVSQIYDAFCVHGISRNDMVIALGGGVTGDIAGFAAATYLRGIRHLIQIPTTLLAQVDSSVGGKCGVDLPHGKNLVGAIRQPDLVLIDPDLLKSLSEEVFSAGMAEVIKYGCIGDPNILDVARKKPSGSELEQLIATCVKIKIKVVEEDETELGLRRILNFGHTIGHAVERLGNYSEFSHGEAVAVGMMAAVQIGETIGITEKGSVEKLKELLLLNHLPTKSEYLAEDIYKALLSDKKREGEEIYFIYIKEFGKYEIKKTPVIQLKEAIKAIGE